jgi:predicted NBD/HSP70 family sugar kinase
VWVAGYWANGYWVPGYWNFVGVRVGPVIRGGVVIGHGPFRGPHFGPRPMPFRR